MDRLLFNGAKLVAEAERMGASPEEAERAEAIIRDMVFEAYDSGMSVEEIKAEFGRIARELRAMGSMREPGLK